VVTMTLQALISWLLLRAQFRRRLPQLTAATVLG